MTPHMHQVLAALAGKRFPLEDEKQTQAAIDTVLRERFHGDFVLREFPLIERKSKASRGIIDFLVFPGGTGIEVKLKGGRRDIARQVSGYAVDPMLAGIVLATAKPIALPATIGGKPVAVFDLGRAWL